MVVNVLAKWKFGPWKPMVPPYITRNLTVKSDDMIGRGKTYEAITKGNIIPDPGIPRIL
jgi:hypothetical protein